MTYETYGVKVDAKGNYAFGPKHESHSRQGAALHRSAICFELHGKDRVYAQAITYRDGRIYRRQTIPSPVVA